MIQTLVHIFWSHKCTSCSITLQVIKALNRSIERESVSQKDNFSASPTKEITCSSILSSSIFIKIHRNIVIIKSTTKSAYNSVLRNCFSSKLIVFVNYCYFCSLFPYSFVWMVNCVERSHFLQCSSYPNEPHADPLQLNLDKIRIEKHLSEYSSVRD